MGICISQVTNLHGKVKTFDNSSCSWATVSLLRLDSVVIHTTFTSNDGDFSFDAGVVPGPYILSIHHVSFKALYRRIFIKENSPRELGVFTLYPRPDTLKAALITQEASRPTIRGDTLEYNTTRIRMNRYDNIQALLSRLPGVQVEPDGSIRVNGQRVERILVDGEDIFDGSPSFITRDFNADMVAKVQLLKKKSRQSEFTGIDDGKRTVTMNIVLKADAKRGYFGKAEAGGGDRNFYNADGMIGSFMGRQQLVGVAMASDIGRIAVGIGSGIMVLAPGRNDLLGASAGSGIPRVRTGGLHYANSWGVDQNHASGNYQYGHVSTEPVTTNTSVQTLQDKIYLQRQLSHSVNSQDQQGGFATFGFSNGLSTWQFDVSGGESQGRNRFGSSSYSCFNDTLVNNSERTIQSDGRNQNFQSVVSWRIRGRRKSGRVFSVVAGLGGNDNTTNGYLYSINRYFQQNGVVLSVDTTDQRKRLASNHYSLNIGVNYTDSLGKHAQWGVSYSFLVEKNHSNQDTYGRQEEQYDRFIDSLSSQYREKVTTHQAGLSLVDNIGKIRLTLGVDGVANAYQQKDRLRPTPVRYAWVSLAPRMISEYAISSSSSLTLTYNGTSRPPSVQQLQPIQNNTDPLHIVQGNPHLRPVYTHSFGGNFQQFRSLSITLGWTIDLNNSDISMRTLTDSLGRQVSQALNVKGARAANVFFSLGSKINALGIDVRFNSNLRYNKQYNYINADLSGNDIYSTISSLSLAKFVPDKFDIVLGGGGGYSYTRSSVDPLAALRYWTANGGIHGSYFPVPGLELSSSANYAWRQKTRAFDANNTTWLLNAYLDKSFWNNKVSLRWSIENILDQNAGVSRTSSYNETSESITNTIGRYWMISAIFRFDKKPGKE